MSLVISTSTMAPPSAKTSASAGLDTELNADQLAAMKKLATVFDNYLISNKICAYPTYPPTGDASVDKMNNLRTRSYYGAQIALWFIVRLQRGYRAKHGIAN